MTEWDPDRVHLLRQLPRASVGAEIGVFEGDFTRRILAAVEPRMLHLIDPWVFQRDRPQTIYGGRVPRVQSQQDMDRMYLKVKTRFASARTRIHRGYSAAVADQLEDGCLDWVYIDGNHLYQVYWTTWSDTHRR